MPFHSATDDYKTFEYDPEDVAVPVLKWEDAKEKERRMNEGKIAGSTWTLYSMLILLVVLAMLIACVFVRSNSEEGGSSGNSAGASPKPASGASDGSHGGS